MELTVDNYYRIQWEAFGIIFAYGPGHNYITGEILLDDDPRCDMSSIMLANPIDLHPILKCSTTNEVGRMVICDF